MPLWTLLLQIVGIRLELSLLLSEIYVNTYSFRIYLYLDRKFT